MVAGWLKDILGLPQQASYAFVTGCQMAHVTALAAARHKVLADKGWSAEKQGLAGSPPIRVLVGEHHETLLRAIRHLGIGTDAVVQVAMTNDGTIDVGALQAAFEKDPDMPTIVSLAGSKSIERPNTRDRFARVMATSITLRFESRSITAAVW